ncbi:MAG: PilW family protein [Proteobacteria bacterium]|nr:PilW family protein [Pseudomonadota bacterium]
MRRTDGFTLLELMIAGLILAVVTTYLLQTFTVSEKAYAVVEDVTEAQQSMRAIADLIEKDIRHAGFMVTEAGAVCGLDEFNSPDRLYLSDADAIQVGDLDPDLGSGFAGNNVGSGLNTLNLDLVLEKADPDPAYDTNGDGTLDSDFQVDGGVIIVDRDNPDRGTACGTVVQVTIGASEIRVDIETPPLAPLAAGSADLIAIPAHEYVLNGLILMRDGLELVSGVEDLQIAYFVDANADNLVDPGEYLGDGIGADYQANQVDATDIRELRVNLVTRTQLQDRDFVGGQFQTTENRLAIAGNDGFRRRVHTSTALLRNTFNRAGSGS